jgi:hypothetical protein
MLGLALCALACLCACGEEETAAGEDVTDVRVPIPEEREGFLTYVTPEVRIESAEDKLYCLHLDYDGPDIAVPELDVEQGNYGHHVVMLSTTDPKPHGTLEDCSDPKDMSKYRSLILPETPLPENHAVQIKSGTHFVLQFHYVNASPKPILVRDVARLRLMDTAQVQTWVTTVTTNSLRLEVPARAEASEEYDCTLTEDVDLLVVGGHMHEQGTVMEIFVGPSADALESIYYVDPWKPEYRDAPPVTLLFDNPVHLTAGSVIRTRCQWNSQLDEDTPFPHEMCSCFGYIAGTQTPLHCEAK